jgi:glycosyltransferase involved in cell wall biosynthesis
MISESFPPEVKSAATLFYELAASLVEKGHKVSVVTRNPSYYLTKDADAASVPAEEVRSGIFIYRRKIPRLSRSIPLIRGLEHFIIGFSLFLEALKIREYDLILVYLPPLPLGIAGIWLSKLRNKPVVVNLHDLYPQAVIDMGLLKNKFIIWLSRRIESLVYRRSNYFAVPYEGNREYLIKKGVAEQNIEIVPNWADTEYIKPDNKDNDFSRKYKLTNRFVVSFAGSIGFAQGLEVMIRAASLMQNYPEIRFLIVGDGVKKAELKVLAQSLNLNNIDFIEPQSLKVYPQVLNSSDVGLVALRKDFVIPALPGKLLTIMAAGISVIASVPLNGETPKIINEYGCGICVEPGSPDALVGAILKLYNNSALREQMGQAGRNAAVMHYSRQMAVAKYENIFQKAQKGL